MRDRRSELRHSTNLAAEVSWTEANNSQTVPGIIRNISRSGAQIQVERPIRLRTSLRIRAHEQSIEAKVITCIRFGADYLIGVEVGPEFEGVLRREQLSYAG